MSEQKEKKLTDYVAGFVCDAKWGDLPENVIELGKKSMLDGIGLALSGSIAKSGDLVRQYLHSLGISHGSASVFGSNIKTAPRFAAFANGVGIHADDYDDTQLAVATDRVYGLLTHPTAPCLPSAIAQGEALNASGPEVFLAYQLGVEVECKIAEAIHPRHYQTGFHSTATCGTFASASAAGKLLGLDREKMCRALSIAGSQSAGLRENFGTMTKPFHAGRSAESGLVAAELAHIGWTAASTILEAPRGFFHAAGGGYDSRSIEDMLGRPWTFAEPGISIKPHPSGSLTHPGMTEMLRLIKENDITPDQIDRVKIGTNHNMPNTLIHRKPTNELEAKFSMEFCMAILLLERRAGLSEFTDEVVMRQDVQAMIKKIDFGVDPEAEAAGFHKMTTIITIILKDGRVIRGKSDFGRGSPSMPMNYTEVADKFLENCEYAKFDNQKAKKIVEMIRDIEKLASIRELTALLSI